MWLKKHSALFFAIVWQTVLFRRLPTLSWDSGVVIPWFVKNGLVFYRDFDPGTYMPLPKLLIIPLSYIFKNGVELTIYLALLLSIATIIVVYRVTLQHLSKKAASLALIFYSVWFGFILKQNEIDINLLIGLLTLLMLDQFYQWLKTKDQKRVVVSGLFASLAFFSQQMAAIPIGVIFTLMLLGYKKFKTTLPFLFGFAPVTIIIFGYFLKTGVFKEFIDETFLYYLSPARYPFSGFSYNPRDLTMLAFLLIPFFISSLWWLTKSKKSIETTGLLLVIFLTSASFFLVVFHPRRFLFLLPLVSFTSGLIYQNFPQFKKQIKTVSLILILALGIYSGLVIVPWYIQALKRGNIYQNYGLSTPDDYVYEATTWIKKNSSPEARIHVFGPMLLYYETQRLPANKKTYSALPWTYEPFEETKKLFTQKPADFWLVDERLFTRFSSWGYDHQSQYIRSFLGDNYELVINFDWMSVYKLSSKNAKK